MALVLKSGNSSIAYCFADMASREPIILATRRLDSSLTCIQFHQAVAYSERDLLQTATILKVGKKRIVERLWREFFLDPSQWWDYRLEKVNERHPDFKHKRTHEGLWLDSKLKPLWVAAELAAMAPGIVESNILSWNKKLAAHTRAGQYEKTMEHFRQMELQGLNPDEFSFVPVLNACAHLVDLQEGRRIHARIMESSCESNMYVASTLVDMYAKCGSIEEARRVFDNMPSRNVVTWNMMILGLVKCRQGQKALELYQEMQEVGVEPNSVTFVGVLNACASIEALEEGIHLHTQISEKGWESDAYVSNSLIDMYAKCGSIEEAWKVFNNMPIRNVVAWSVMILGYGKSGQGQKALELFQQMQLEGVKPDPVTFVGALNACASLASLEDGRVVHVQIIQTGLESNLFVGSSLVDMYAKCGSIYDARLVFDKMAKRNVVSWNTMILGYVKCGQGLQALELLRQMQQEGVEPDSVTFLGVLNACASLEALDEGRGFHEEIVQRGCESDVFVGSCLIDMYAKCGSIEDAQRVFNKMPTRNAVAWTAMIGGYVKCGQGQKALDLFIRMQQVGVEPDPVTFVGVLNACASLLALEAGRSVHHQVILRGFESDVFVGNSLVDMYAKCGKIEDAQSVFNQMSTRNVVSWSAMIHGFVKCGQGQKALDLYRQMQLEGINPDPVTFVGALNACANLAALEEGRRIHEVIIQRGYESDVFVGGSLVDMYAKCGCIKDACRVFDKMPTQNVVAWSALIVGYVRCGQGNKALDLYKQMFQEGVEPDQVTFIGVLNACASVAALDEGRCVHEEIIKRGWECDLFLCNSLVDMYAKCGSIEDAQNVFRKISTRKMA